MSARFEIVRSDTGDNGLDQPWHARYVASNGRIVWTTEQYARRGAAVAAIRGMSRGIVLGAVLRVRDVDERTP